MDTGYASHQSQQGDPSRGHTRPSLLMVRVPGAMLPQMDDESQRYRAVCLCPHCSDDESQKRSGGAEGGTKTFNALGTTAMSNGV